MISKIPEVGQMISKFTSASNIYRISTFFCGNFISAISAVHYDTAYLKTAEN
jgi:hypothetical protein